MIKRGDFLKKRFILALALVFLLLVNIWEVLLNYKSYENYHIGLPAVDNPALEEMIAHYLIDKQPVLLKGDSYRIFQLQGIEENNKKIKYGKLDNDKLKKYYASILTAEYPYRKMDGLLEDKELLYELVDHPLRESLPKISLANNQLKIETGTGEKTFNLLDIAKEQAVNLGEVLSIDIVSVNEDAFYLQVLTEYEEREHIYHLFIKQDFSHFLFFKHSSDMIREFITSDDYAKYDLLFTQIDEQRRFLQVFGYNYIIHPEKGELQEIGYYDLLSNKGKYTYLSGSSSSFTSGNQKIKRTGDVIGEIDDIYAKFHLSYRNIVKKLEWPTFGSANGKIVYFSEDIVLLYINYTSKFPTGTHRTNVIIDLQEDKQNPLIYLIDLGVVF